VVVNDERVVLGLLRAEELRRGQDESIERVMRPGPSTFLHHRRLEERPAQNRAELARLVVAQF